MKTSLANSLFLVAATLLSSASAAPYRNVTCSRPGPPATDVPGGFQNAAYYVNWAIYGRNYQPQQIPASQLSHVLYAFANVSADGSVTLTDPWADVQIKSPTDSLNETGTNMYGNLKQLYLHKKANRQMKTLLSLGGWTLSTHFPAAARTPETRANFTRTAVDLVKNLGFDGLDIDWEYPATPQEADDFVLLLRDTRAALDAYAAEHNPGYHFLLTIAVPAGSTRYGLLKMKEMDQYLDNWYLMAYDYSGSWDTRAGHNANLYPSRSNNASTPFSTEATVNDYLAGGVTPHKLVLGMPIYGRSFQSVSGMGQVFNGTGGGSWENGVWDYKVLPKPGAVEVFDRETQASYSYDNKTRELISYDTPKVAAIKGKYIKSKGLGGGMWWETSSDKVGEGSLISTVAKTLGKLEQSLNQLSYPASSYDNLRLGMP